MVAVSSALTTSIPRRIHGFGKSTAYSFGVEEEFQLLDPDTLELKPIADKIIASLNSNQLGQIKHELMKSVVETSTVVCKNVEEAAQDLTSLREIVIDRAQDFGALIASSGTTPVSCWEGQEVTDQQRYRDIIAKLQWIARRELIFGLHVHVGMDSADKCAYVFNELRSELPLLLALSANSAFWQGKPTGLQSSRIKIFDAFPRSGMPQPLANGWDEYEQLLKRGAATGLVPDHTYIWWDLRPHPGFGTLEIRICDAQTRLSDTLGLTALIQAMAAYHGDNFDAGKPQSTTIPQMFIEENRWSAARYGLDGQMLNFATNEMASTRTLIAQLLDRVEPVAKRLNSLPYFDHLTNMLRSTGATRSLEAWHKGDNSVRAAGLQIVSDTAV